MTKPAHDTTKPSRVNRKLKRRWKKPKIIDLIKFGLADCYRVTTKAPSMLEVVKDCLTMLDIDSILTLLSPHVTVRDWPLVTNGVNRRKSGFFMRKISVLHFMSDWVDTRKSGRVVCPVGQSTQSGAMTGLMLSGLNPLTNEIAL